jgi:hypothetical protein
MTAEDVQRVITPILKLTYGKGSMVDAAAADLAQRIAAENYDDRGREHMVMLRCWDWFTGGSTAESVARKIEAALAEGETA